MNRLQVLAVRDRQLDAFTQPFFAPTVGAGIRAFSNHVNEPNSEPNKHPEDYELYHVGEFDPNTGMFTPWEGKGPQQVAIASNLLQSPRK